MHKPVVQPFFHTRTGTFSYVVHDARTGYCCIIDPVLDFDLSRGVTDLGAAREIVAYVVRNQLRVAWLLETHVHADHLCAVVELKKLLGGQTAIGSGVHEVYRAISRVLGLAQEMPPSCFDRFVQEGDELELGTMSIRVLATPGHTPSCMTYLVADAAFVGDTLFMPDLGTARCDFPGASAGRLYDSIQRLLALPGDCRLFVGHDYPPETRASRAYATAAEQRACNIHVASRSRADFVRLRRARDESLQTPQLMIAALQVNVCGGRFPPSRDNGFSYISIPVDALNALLRADQGPQ
jgi:glyoxylase-like metal-dependent hydrolase (beta-lactamase superfamily II)